MSDTPRTYEGRFKPVEFRLGRRPGRSGLLVGGLAIALLAIALLWSTRDSQPMGQFIPADQKFGLVFVEPLETRNAIAQMGLWRSLPESWGLSTLPDALDQNMGMPDWVLNNLVGRECYVTGNDLKGFADALFLTKMSRVGKALAWFARLTPSVEGDYAGGLGLRAVPESGLYYAVRGRTLVVSRSREALIRSLTLRKDDSIDAQALAAVLNGSGGEQVRGVVSLAPDDPCGRAFQHVSFALHVSPSRVLLNCRGIPSDSWKQRLSAVLDNAAPHQLAKPLDGLVTVSADFGMPVRDLLEIIGKAFDQPALLPALSHTTEGEPPSLPQIAAAFLGPLGPGIRLSLRGIDVNEIMPLPELAATFDAEPAVIEALFAGLPPVPADAPAWASFPRYDPETRRVHLPLIAGPSLEPTAAPYGNGLLVSTSRTVADALLSAPSEAEVLPDAGNLYLALRPYDCVQALVEAAREFARSNLLRGYNPESFEEAAARWLAAAGTFQEFTALVSVENGAVTLESRLTSAP